MEFGIEHRHRVISQLRGKTIPEIAIEVSTGGFPFIHSFGFEKKQNEKWANSLVFYCTSQLNFGQKCS